MGKRAGGIPPVPFDCAKAYEHRDLTCNAVVINGFSIGGEADWLTFFTQCSRTRSEISLFAGPVTAADITYIPMAHGFAYLVAIIDWYSRRMLAWRLSNTMESSFCLEALREALEQFPKPETFNTDQGPQYTSEAFTGALG